MSSVENGSAVSPLNRAAWERALGWPKGSLAAAYERGARPDGGSGGDGDGGQGADVLDRAEVPAEYRDHPDVRDVLASSLPDDDQVRVLRVWLGSHQAYVQSFSAIRDLRKAR